MSRAAERNHDGALYWLGDIYLNGRGVPYDRIKANHYLEAAAGAGNIDAMKDLGLYYREGTGITDTIDLGRSLYCFEQAAMTGDIDSMCIVGDVYLNEGEHTDRGKCDKAKHWFETAADEGDSYAMARLGWMYAFIYENYEAAHQWLEKASELDEPSAMFYLSTLYLTGKGVKEYPEKAALLCQKSVDLGYEPAIPSMGILIYTGAGVLEDKKKGFEMLIPYVKMNARALDFIKWVAKNDGYAPAIAYLRSQCIDY